MSQSECPDLGPKWVRLSTNGTNPGIFQTRFSTFWVIEPKCIESDLKKYHEPKCTETDLKKIPGFVPFEANLTHFEPKSGHPGESASVKDLMIKLSYEGFVSQ